MCSFVEHYVQREPERPADWARPEEAAEAKCYYRQCALYSELREFLHNPDHEERRFGPSTDHRHHLQYRVPTNCLGKWDVETNTLQITKTLKGYEAKQTEWERRAATAQELLEQLPLSLLASHLGSELEYILNLEWARKATKASSSESPLKSQKRKRNET